VSCKRRNVTSDINNSHSERHAELVSASPRIIGVILKQVQDDALIMVPDYFKWCCTL